MQTLQKQIESGKPLKSWFSSAGKTILSELKKKYPDIFFFLSDTTDKTLIIIGRGYVNMSFTFLRETFTFEVDGQKPKNLAIDVDIKEMVSLAIGAVEKQLKKEKKKKKSSVTLRSQIIRLAHKNPELRPDLLPLLKEGGSDGWGRNAKVLITNITPKGFSYSFSYQFSPSGIFSSGSGDIQKVYATVQRQAQNFGENVMSEMGLLGTVVVVPRLAFGVTKNAMGGGYTNISLTASCGVKLKRASSRNMNKQSLQQLEATVFDRFGYGVEIWG